MNIKRAKQEMKDTVAAYLEKDEQGAYRIPAVRQRPVLLLGPPGVGKTQIMEQVAQECGIGLVAYTITHHTRQSAIGLPFIEHKSFGGRECAVTEYTMSEIVASVYEKMERTGLKEGILFLDEINCVSETLAPAMLQFLQKKSFGTHKIPEGWILAAAGNPPEYNRSVRDFDIVTLDRIRRMDIEPDYAVWKEYALQAGIHPAILAYLAVRRQYLCLMETTVDGRQFATPRGWEDLSELLWVYEAKGLVMDRELIAEYIQFPKIAKDFAAYLDLYGKYQSDYQAERILEGVFSETMIDRLLRAPFDERVSVVGLLTAGLNGKFREVYQFGEELALRMEKLRSLQKTIFAEDAKTGSAGSGSSGAAALTAYGALISSFEEELRLKKEEELISREECARRLRVLTSFEEDLSALKKAGPESAGAVWEFISNHFSADSDRYEALRASAGAALEHAFDFMEAAFAGSQELVLFVTELNTGYYSLDFLKEYDCERYYQYNRDLLFSDEETEIGSLIRKRFS